MKLIVGLGNPGKEYVGTRHNIGFSVLDKISDYISDFSKKEDKDYVSISFPFKDDKVVLLYPHKFMNLSGEVVKMYSDYFKIKLEDILIIHDDMDLPVGKIRLRKNGKSAGHKGIQNIIDQFKSEEFKRIKVGIDKPKGNSIDFVLGRPSKGEEENNFNNGINQAFEAVIDVLNNGFDHAMNKFN